MKRFLSYMSPASFDYLLLRGIDTHNAQVAVSLDPDRGGATRLNRDGSLLLPCNITQSPVILSTGFRKSP